MNSFGTKFVITNAAYQPLIALNKTPTGRHYVHLATVTRGFKEYMAYLDRDTNEIWIDELDPKEPWLLKVIKDDNEWNDIRNFLEEAKLLRVGTDEEILITEQFGIIFE
jgi:hypothetical protein